MKTILLLLLASGLAALSGCATAASPVSFAATVAAEHGAPAALVATLQRGGRLRANYSHNVAHARLCNAMGLSDVDYGDAGGFAQAQTASSSI